MNKWTLVSPVVTMRTGAGLAAINGYLYVIGKEEL